MANDRITSLESIRGLAALYVVAHHWMDKGSIMDSPLHLLPLRFGIEAVLVFFLLSGFVIAYSSEARVGFKWKQYAAQRIRRIYPIFILSLLFAYVCLCVNAGKFVHFDIRNFLLNILMLQDVNKPGIWAAPFGGNGPLWSLSYEIWFYSLYAVLLLAAPVRRQLFFAALISYSAIIGGHFYPNPMANFCSLFLIWWCGVEMAREYRGGGGIHSQAKHIPFAYFSLLRFGMEFSRSSTSGLEIQFTSRRIPSLNSGCIFSPSSGSFP